MIEYGRQVFILDVNKEKKAILLHIQYCTLGRSDFEKNATLSMLFQLLLDLNSKISCLHVASFLDRRASENLDYYPKISKKKRFSSLRQGGNIF